MVEELQNLPDKLMYYLNNISNDYEKYIQSPEYEYSYYKERMGRYNAKNETSFKCLNTDNDIVMAHNKYLSKLPIKPNIVESIGKQIEVMFPGYNASNSGMHLYPSGGFLGWHTNSNAEYTRVYVSYSKQGNGYFKWLRNDLKGVSQDTKGWMMRIFDTSKPYLWHCVYTDEPRISIGYRLTKLNNN